MQGHLWLIYETGASSRAAMAGAVTQHKPLIIWCGPAKRGHWCFDILNRAQLFQKSPHFLFLSHDAYKNHPIYGTVVLILVWKPKPLF